MYLPTLKMDVSLHVTPYLENAFFELPKYRVVSYDNLKSCLLLIKIKFLNSQVIAFIKFASTL